MSKSAAATMGLQQAERRVIWACAGWALLSAVLFVLAAVVGAQAGAFAIVVSLLKVGAFLLAMVLCWRNAMTPDILSGRSVWQALSVGMAFYALADITVMLWRSLWGVTGSVALGDIFYLASYLFLAIGLLLAVLPRRITLSLVQTLGIAIAGVLGIVLASWISFQAPEVSATIATDTAEVVAQGPATLATADSERAEFGQPNLANAPAIVQTVEQRLSRVTKHFGLLYVAGDCVLVVMAVALLVAFWGGTYSEAWKLVSLAGLCLYVADMFWIYEVGQGIYRQGAFWEIFWILSALFFGLSAGVEHGISTRMKARTPHRHWT